MIELVFIVMFLVLPVLSYSVWGAARKKKINLHKNLQKVISVALLIAIILFEVDLRMHDWRQFAKQSPYYETILFPFLYFHLFFAVSTCITWIWTLYLGVFKYGKMPQELYRQKHKLFGLLAVVGMFFTTFSGWIFYYLAFYAKV